MKLQLSQALGTVLNIQIDEVEGRKAYVAGLNVLGYIDEVTFEQAIWKAMEGANLQDPSNFAIFPMQSGREDYYMAIERELLRQEISPSFDGKLMWQMMSAGDPRELIEMIMLQIREAAQAIMHPVTFQTALLRVGCLIVSCMQWTTDWIGRLRVREATMRAHEPEPPKVVEFAPPAPPDQPPPEPVPPLFGVAGLQVVPPPEPEKKGDVVEVTMIDGGDGVPPLVLRKETIPPPPKGKKRGHRKGKR